MSKTKRRRTPKRRSTTRARRRPSPAPTSTDPQDAELYSINALSEKLFIDRRTLKKCLADLRPAKIQGKSKLYCMADVKLVLEGRSSVKTVLDALKIKQIEEQTRESTARADLLEMERKEKANELVSLTEVAAIVNPILLAVRQRLNAMPSELANLVNPTDPVHAQQQAMAWVERTLPMIRAGLPQPKAQP